MAVTGTASNTARVAGSVQVCCIHGREKRQVVELEFNRRIEFAQICPCCENLFTTTTDEPYLCISCGDRPAGEVFPGANELPKGVR